MRKKVIYEEFIESDSCYFILATLFVDGHPFAEIDCRTTAFPTKSGQIAIKFLKKQMKEKLLKMLPPWFSSRVNDGGGGGT